MPVYQDPAQLQNNLKHLFERIAEEENNASEAISNTRLIVRLKIVNPALDIYVNGRINPVKITYGANRLKPDLDVTIEADALHYILLDQLSLKQALTSGQMKVRGPILKSFVLEGIFRRGQDLYPKIYQQGS